jgi:hypothetical protein
MLKKHKFIILQFCWGLIQFFLGKNQGVIWVAFFLDTFGKKPFPYFFQILESTIILLLVSPYILKARNAKNSQIFLTRPPTMDILLHPASCFKISCDWNHLAKSGSLSTLKIAD